MQKLDNFHCCENLSAVNSSDKLKINLFESTKTIKIEFQNRIPLEVQTLIELKLPKQITYPVISIENDFNLDDKLSFSVYNYNKTTRLPK
jgi:hypothetical protein